ncbi:hypothetical protein AMTR_s00074p00167830 [Amborella trichopoda]|uniref:lipid-A-disaccharide synthase n=1 Tax=Amborella trichopoda TaxID=13333 RepID=W1NM61_AMBTC|nr:hypothetical protein AMTR_s00074p00167830 [Amborella trichopoda]
MMLPAYASKAAIATSGTAVMELQLARLPCVVGYRAHILTEWFIRLRAKSKYMSLPNILLDSAVIPEALLSNCTADRLSMLLKYEELAISQASLELKAYETVSNL